PPSYCRDVVVAGNIIQTVQAGLRQAYEVIASAPMVFVLTKVSTSPRVSSYLVKAYPIYLCCCKDWKLLFFDVATSFDSAVHRVHAVSIDAADLDVASTVSAACIVAAGYLVSAGICFCCYSILLLREDLSRNLELTESTPSLGEDCWE
ncbi:hypothetical protein Tco_0871137, partial [Tanacetum coccineum]